MAFLADSYLISLIVVGRWTKISREVLSLNGKEEFNQIPVQMKLFADLKRRDQGIRRGQYGDPPDHYPNY